MHMLVWKRSASNHVSNPPNLFCDVSVQKIPLQVLCVWMDLQTGVAEVHQGGNAQLLLSAARHLHSVSFTWLLFFYIFFYFYFLAGSTCDMFCTYFCSHMYVIVLQNVFFFFCPSFIHWNWGFHLNFPSLRLNKNWDTEQSKKWYLLNNMACVCKWLVKPN